MCTAAMSLNSVIMVWRNETAFSSGEPQTNVKIQESPAVADNQYDAYSSVSRFL